MRTPAVQLRLRRLALPLAQPIQSAIHRIDTVHVLLTELRDAQGHRGIGAALAFRAGFVDSMCAIARELCPVVEALGCEPIVAVREAMLAQVNYVGLSGIAVQALATIDMALWVLAAERARMPLHRLLGSCTRRLDAYHGHGLWMGTQGDALAAEAAGIAAQGYRAIKLRVGSDDLAADLDRVRRVRRAIGDAVVLLVDANQSGTPDYAMRLGRALADFDVRWYEEPVSYDDVAGHARLAATLTVPVATGQSEYLERGMDGYLQANAAQVLMPDVCRMGGITGWRNAAALAAARRVAVSNHLYAPWGQHLQASIPHRTWVDTIDWLDPLFRSPVRVVDGEVVLPDEPGLGMPLDDAAIERFTVAVG